MFSGDTRKSKKEWGLILDYNTHSLKFIFSEKFFFKINHFLLGIVNYILYLCTMNNKKADKGSFKLANQTGRLMFKFDNDEPQECATIYDYGKVTIEMQQQKELDTYFTQNTNSIEFTSKDGKKFRLFIENCH
jgi:hypothetical protein|tara:strand:- start:24920 stop:25318 length:399 start_codon:yes stop_codon:yes gene_type:complete